MIEKSVTDRISETPELDKIKARAQFFKRGHIIPRRILASSKRKQQHLVTFGSDSWVLSTRTGYLVVCDIDTGGCAIRFKRLPKKLGVVNYLGSPYHRQGTGTHWVGNSDISPKGFENAVLKTLDEKNRGVWDGPCKITFK